MLEVDGGKKSGSGTILRMSLAMSAIRKLPLHIINIRRKRRQPGLRPQHLEAVVTAAKLCNATVEGCEVGSEELWFYPQEIEGGRVEAEIGTAGSIPMVIITVLPICVFARNPVSIHISKGGTDVRHSPTINYVKHVFLPVLQRMGVKASLTVHKYGYYPKGMGEVTVKVDPTTRLSSITFTESKPPKTLKGVSVCTYLSNQSVAERQAKAAVNLLHSHSGSEVDVDVEVVNDFSNTLQKGSSITLWTQTESGGCLGGDAIGEPGKPSEAVGREAAQNLLMEIKAGATVDVHLADLLIPYVALADGESEYFTRSTTDHLEANIWLAEEILGVKFETRNVGNICRVMKKKS